MPSAMLNHSTIQNYIRSQTLAMMRKRKILAYMRAKKRISFAGEGLEREWPIRHKRSPITAFANDDSITFSKQDKHLRASLPPRGYYVEKALQVWDQVINQGKAAIVKLNANVVSELTDDITDQFHEEIYNSDGNASGTKKIHGFATIFDDYTSASGKRYTPAGTYAGLSMVLGNYGGAADWTGTWPDGYGPTQYDFYSALIADSNASTWENGAGWKANAEEILDYIQVNMERNTDMVDVFCLEKTMFHDLRNAIRTKERVIVEKGGQDSLGVKLGFNALNFQGTDIVWEQGIPASQGYALVVDKLLLESWSKSKQLFQTEEDFDIERLGDKTIVYFIGNMFVESPKFLGGIKSSA